MRASIGVAAGDREARGPFSGRFSCSWYPGGFSRLSTTGANPSKTAHSTGLFHWSVA